MDIAAGVRVECTDGSCGLSRYVIIDPATATITHVVVGEPNRVAETYLVPLDYVLESSAELIRLKCTRAELKALPEFSSFEKLGSVRSYLAYSPPELWMGPLMAYWPVPLSEEHRYVPEGELSVQRGAQVEATDGRVGSVDGFLVEPASGHITHLVLREGHLWGRRDVTVPVSEIDRIEQDTVHLRIDREQVGALAPFVPGSAGSAIRDASVTKTLDGGTGAARGTDRIQSLIEDLARSDRTIREDARRSLVSIGPPAVEPLAAALAHEREQVRWEAAKALQQIDDPAIAPAMIAALEDDDSGVQWIAAESLAFLGRDGVVPLLKALVARSDSSRLQRGAHHVLRFLSDETLKKELAPVLRALEGLEPALEVPVAAHRVLVALGR
jgi:hypothetical protein